MWIPYLSLPIGFGLLLLQLIADFVALWLRIDTPFGLPPAGLPSAGLGEK